MNFTVRTCNQTIRLLHKSSHLDTFPALTSIRHFHARYNTQWENASQRESSGSSSGKETLVSDVVGGVTKVKLPSLKPVGRSRDHEKLLQAAQQKVQQIESRKRFINDFIIPLRELYFNNASRFLNSPKSPAKRAKGVVPDYTSYFPASAIKYDKTGMALSEIHVHQKFNAWWMRTTGRGPTPKGQVSEKKKKKRK